MSFWECDKCGLWNCNCHEPPEPARVNAIFETQAGEVVGTTEARVKRVERQDDGSLTVVIDHWPQPAEPDGFGSAEHWKEKAQYWAGEAYKLRQQALRGDPVGLDRYDAGLLGGQDGMPAYVWHDIIRAELDRAYDFYVDQLDRSSPQPAEPVDETLICTLDGYQFYLGPEYDGELEWDDAKKWCESLGENYELPNRLVMLAICMNEATAALLTEDSYWTSTEFEVDPFYAAWLQEWSSGSPGLQGYASKSHLYRARAVRRCRL